MPRIYYLFAVPPSSGGDFVNVEHVAALNRMGYDARALYGSADDGWRQFTVPVEHGQVAVAPDDIVVLGEAISQFIAAARGMDCRKVLHDQNPFFTFLGFESAAALNGYGLEHVIVPSDDCAARLRAVGVTAPLSRVHPALPDYFRPAAKTLQIAHAPRKRWAEAPYIRELFKARVPEFTHVPWVAINGLTREEVARVLGESAIFASFALLESLGLLALEAMASGCHVVGYTGHGGAEYATPENGDWIADGAQEMFVSALRDACRAAQGGLDNPKIAGGHATAARFNQDAFERQLAAAWTTILGAGAARYRR